MKPEIAHINFDISGAHLMAVVGPLASGKSSLMAGLTKQIEMTQVCGAFGPDRADVGVVVVWQCRCERG